MRSKPIPARISAPLAALGSKRLADLNGRIFTFICTDVSGNFVVETKRGTPDRQAMGQILGYIGWVAQKLCQDGREVRGILIASEATESLRMAVAAVPSQEIYLYEISFRLFPDRRS